MFELVIKLIGQFAGIAIPWGLSYFGHLNSASLFITIYVVFSGVNTLLLKSLERALLGGDDHSISSTYFLSLIILCITPVLFLSFSSSMITIPFALLILNFATLIYGFRFTSKSILKQYLILDLISKLFVFASLFIQQDSLKAYLLSGSWLLLFATIINEYRCNRFTLTYASVKWLTIMAIPSFARRFDVLIFNLLGNQELMVLNRMALAFFDFSLGLSTSLRIYLKKYFNAKMLRRVAHWSFYAFFSSFLISGTLFPFSGDSKGVYVSFLLLTVSGWVFYMTIYDLQISDLITGNAKAFFVSTVLFSTVLILSGLTLALFAPGYFLLAYLISYITLYSFRITFFRHC